MNTLRILSILAFSFLTSATLCAQPPGRGGFGGRGGGEEGGRGGFRGGFGGRGGGGEEGGRGGFRGGFGGGPGGGGFGGRGGPGGGGFGGRGGPGGGGRGNFDPSSFLSRLDRNGNGVIDPDEQQGPAQFIISRLQQSDPSIRPGQPIPLSKVTEGFNRMRGERGGDRGDSRNAGEEALEAELLVPGFGVEDTPVPLLGFGPTAEMLSVPVTAEDERQASEMMRRFDRNRDGYVSKDELSSRMSGNPMDFDRNRDGKLTTSELAVRYARRREGEEQARERRRDERTRDRGEDTVEIPDVFNGRKSYRSTAGRNLPEGLPGEFTDKDKNGDGQVTMAEYSADWSDDVVAKFFESDFNRDGVITAAEALRRVEEGSATQMASTTAAAAPAPLDIPAGDIDEKYLKMAKNIISRHDDNGDNALTASEWKDLLMSPAAADTNRDGKVTINEYALWTMSRSRRK